MNKLSSQISYNLLFILLIFLQQTAIAQNDTLYYFFNKEGKSCKPKKAQFMGMGIKEDDRIRYSNYSNPEGKLVMTGYFKDSALTSREGEFLYFNKEGRVTELENYSANKLNGYRVVLNDKYLCEDSLNYENGELRNSISYTYFESGKVLTRKYIDSPKNGKGFVTYFENGDVNVEGHWIDGTGTQFEYFPHSSKIMSVYKHESGKKVTEQHFKENGSEIPLPEYTKQRKEAMEAFEKAQHDKMPVFTEDPKGFGTYFMRRYRAAFGREFEMNAQNLQYTITFYLNKKGLPFDLKVTGLPSGSSLYNHISAVLNECPAWEMKTNEPYGPIMLTLNFNRY